MRPGDRLGPYRLLGPLGRGGMGEVFAAVHGRIGQPVAIKILGQGTDRLQRARLVQEARALARIDHPGIVRILTSDETEDGTVYLVMERLAGRSLREWLDAMAGPVPWLLGLGLGRQIADAMAAVHEQGIVHRDLKPANIMLVPDPEQAGGRRTKIVDFGIAKVTTAAPAQTEDTQVDTGTPLFLGTAAYAAPEQIRNGAIITDRADVYALGVVLYEMLAGQPPFGKDLGVEVLAHHLHTSPRPLSALAPEVPVELCALIDAMLVKDPARRPAMAEVRDALCAIPMGAMHRPGTGGRPRRRWPKLVGAVIGAVGLLLLARAEEARLRRQQTARQSTEALLRLGLVDVERWVADLDWTLAQLPNMLEARKEKLDRITAAFAALSEEDRGHPKVQELIIETRHLRGDMALYHGTLALARQVFSDARGDIERALRRQPGDPRLLMLLGMNASKMGKVAMALGRLPEAEMEFTRSIALTEQSCGAEPQDPDERRTLAVSYREHAGALAEQGRLQEALQAYRRSLALLVRNTEDYDGWVRALTLFQFGQALQRAKNRQEARQVHEQGLALLEPIVSRDPANMDYCSALSQLHGGLASLHMEGWRLDLARAGHEEALRRARDVHQHEPTHKLYALALCQVLMDRGRLAHQEGDPLKERQVLQECRRIAGDFLLRDGQDVRFLKFTGSAPSR